MASEREVSKHYINPHVGYHTDGESNVIRDGLNFKKIGNYLMGRTSGKDDYLDMGEMGVKQSDMYENMKRIREGFRIFSDNMFKYENSRIDGAKIDDELLKLIRFTFQDGKDENEVIREMYNGFEFLADNIHRFTYLQMFHNLLQTDELDINRFKNFNEADMVITLSDNSQLNFGKHIAHIYDIYTRCFNSMNVSGGSVTKISTSEIQQMLKVNNTSKAFINTNVKINKRLQFGTSTVISYLMSNEGFKHTNTREFVMTLVSAMAVRKTQQQMMKWRSNKDEPRGTVYVMSDAVVKDTIPTNNVFNMENKPSDIYSYNDWSYVTPQGKMGYLFQKTFGQNNDFKGLVEYAVDYHLKNNDEAEFEMTGGGGGVGGGGGREIMNNPEISAMKTVLNFLIDKFDTGEEYIRRDAGEEEEEEEEAIALGGPGIGTGAHRAFHSSSAATYNKILKVYNSIKSQFILVADTRSPPKYNFGIYDVIMDGRCGFE